MPLAAVHRSPVDGLTVRSKACVRTLKLALAVTAGAPELPYGPTSLGLSAHAPGWISSPELTVRLALLPFLTAPISGSPDNDPRSNVTGAVPVRVACTERVSVGTP